MERNHARDFCLRKAETRLHDRQEAQIYSANMAESETEKEKRLRAWQREAEDIFISLCVSAAISGLVLLIFSAAKFLFF